MVAIGNFVLPPTLFTQIAMIFILALVGYIARKAKVLNPQIQGGLSAVVLNIAMPCAILSSANMDLDPSRMASVLRVFGSAMVFFLVSIFLFKSVARLLKMDKGHSIIFTSLGAFPNTAFIGFPIISIFLPDTGVFYASIFTIAYNLYFFTFGTAQISGQTKFSFRSIFGSINTVASFLMVILYLVQFKMPTVVQTSMEMLGGLATPLSMLVIGSMLASFKFKELFTTPSLYLVSFLRLLAVPTAIFAVLKLLGWPTEVSVVIFVMTALPCGSMTVIAAEQYGTEPLYASKGVLLSTLLFAGTLLYVALMQTML